LTVGPVLSWTNEKIQEHVDKVSSLPGAKILFGGKPLKNHTIPACYGAYEPTAVSVPIDVYMQNFQVCSQ
jgi:1-pyrroline-5-carboxylate dehydrogenase